MDKSTIQTLIDKVIGKKGLIRVPSWWMRKILMQIADWIQEGDDANSEKIGKIKNETDEKIVKITEGDEKFRNLTLPYILVSGTGVVNIDGNEISFTDADKQLIYITGTINFKEQNSHPNNLITYIYIPHLDIRSQGRDMANMFNYCGGLTSLDLSGFNTSAVTNMYAMFSYCKQLSSINLSSFDTSAVTDMSKMFGNCIQLTSLDLSNFDTSAVTDMNGMFRDCWGLTSLDLSNFDTSVVTRMDYMFSNCIKLTLLNLTGFDTSTVTNMENMFMGCNNLTSLNLSSFDTSSVTNMYSMFRNCSNLASLDLSNFDTSSVTDMTWMFYGCVNITSLDLSNFNTSSVTIMGDIFYDCMSITSLILGPNFFKTPSVTMVNFLNCSKWTNDTVVTSLVTNSYDRASAGLGTLTLKLNANTKAALTDEQKAAITAKGYTIA